MASRSISHLPDGELARRAQRGQDAALEVLIGRYRRFARAKSRGYFLIGGDADDLEQEALIGLCNAVRDYRPERSGSFRSFVVLCVTRQIMTAIRTANRRKHQPLNRSVGLSTMRGPEDEAGLEEVLADEQTPGPAESVMTTQAASVVRRRLSALLSELEVQVLAMYVDGWSYVEIGHTLGRESKAIDNALQRIKRKVEASIGEEVAQGVVSAVERRPGSCPRPGTSAEA